MNTRDLLTRGEVALRLKRSEKTIGRWERYFGNAVLRIGRSVVYDFPAVMAAIQRGGLRRAKTKRKRRTQ